MKEELKVKKWGGENAAELTKSPENIVKDFKNGIKQVIIVSAIRSPEFNTTDYLIELGNLLSVNKIDKNIVKEKILEIRNFHLLIVKEKIDNNNLLIIDFIKSRFEYLLEEIDYFISLEDKVLPLKENDYSINISNGKLSLIGFGEILSSEIQVFVVNNLGINGLKAESVLLDGVASEINLLNSEEEIFAILSLRISKRILNIWNSGKIPIVPGYIPGFENGIEKTIGRGYTDATAAMTAIGFSNVFSTTLEIQKSVEGMLSADPRVIKLGVKLINQIDYLTAKEITGVRGAQAKLLHYQVLRKELQESGINVVLFDPFKKLKGTLITKEKCSKSSGVEFIGGRNNIVFFSISSGNMSERGILSDVFTIAKKYASIDIVSTSETEISFTVDGCLSEEKMNKISCEIKQKLSMKEDGYENFVRYKKNKALIFCIGQNLSHSIGSLGKAAIALAKGNINIEMVSQGTMERAIIFGINGDKMNEAINLLHDEFIKNN